MRQAGEQCGFAREAIACGVAFELEELERDVGARHTITGAPHLAHAAAARDPIELEAIGEDVPGVHRSQYRMSCRGEPIEPLFGELERSRVLFDALQKARAVLRIAYSLRFGEQQIACLANGFARGLLVAHA